MLIGFDAESHEDQIAPRPGGGGKPPYFVSLMDTRFVRSVVRLRTMKSHRARRALRALAIVVVLLCALLAAGIRSDIPLSELTPRYASAASQFVPIDGVTVHYRDEGAGPPLVLIHGALASLHTWDGWVSRLASHRRLVRLDLPGYGLTGAAQDKDVAHCA